MRFLGTLKVELSDGTTEKYKDRAKANEDKANDAAVWWTHEYEVADDDSLIVTREVASLSDKAARQLQEQVWRIVDAKWPLAFVLNQERGSESLDRYSVEVARFDSATWRAVKRS